MVGGQLGGGRRTSVSAADLTIYWPCVSASEPTTDHRPPTTTLPRPGFLLWFGLLALVLFLFFRRVACETAEGGITTGVWDNFADLAYHLGFIESFARGGNFPPQHPMYAGVRLTYPLMADFHVAALMVSGLSRTAAMLWQNMLLMLSLAMLLFTFTARVTRSRIAGYVAPWLLFLNGGLGFLLLIPEAREHPGGFAGLFADLPHDYSHWETTLHLGNSLVFWFSTMRSMTLAAPLMVGIWWLWWDGRKRSDAALARQRLWAAGFLTGLLPLAHTHTFLVTFAIALFFALWDIRRPAARQGWAGYFLFATLLAAPQLFLLFSGSATRAGTFFGLSWGWMAGEANLHPAPYWLLNAGLFIPLWLLAMVWRRSRGKRQEGEISALRPVFPNISSLFPLPSSLARLELLLFHLPFIACFVAPNIVKFAPWAWDSIKVLYVWFLAAIPLVALMVARLWKAKVVGGRAVAMVLFVLLTLSGGLDVYRVASGKPDWGIFGAEMIAFSEEIARVTPPRAVILTAPVHNSPVVLSGRLCFMTYPGFLWTNGLPYEERQKEVETLYKGGPDADRLLRERGIGFIVLGPQEEFWATEQKIPLNRDYYGRMPVVARQGKFLLLRAETAPENVPVSRGGKP